jgi:hypothetical protein
MKSETSQERASSRSRKRLTKIQALVLKTISEGRLTSASMYTLRILAERGYVTGIPSMCQITPVGRKALELQQP